LSDHICSRKKSGGKKRKSGGRRKKRKSGRRKKSNSISSTQAVFRFKSLLLHRLHPSSNYYGVIYWFE